MMRPSETLQYRTTEWKVTMALVAVLVGGLILASFSLPPAAVGVLAVLFTILFFISRWADRAYYDRKNHWPGRKRRKALRRS